MAWHREQLFGRSFERHDPAGRLVRRGFTEQDFEEVRRNRGRLPHHQCLMLRVRSSTDGAILGTKAFVEDVFHARRAWFSPTRTSGARPRAGLERSDPLRSARALELRPLR